MTNQNTYGSLNRYTWRSLIIAISVGVIMTAFISFYTLGKNPTEKFISVFGCGLLIGGASLSAGGLLGFIFGIPSIMQNNSARLKYNDNLVQISDWLTKIIVGVGLTQFTRIPGVLIKVGVLLQPNFGNDSWGRNASIALTSFFVLLGFLMLYFWTKTDYSRIMRETDDDLNRQLETLKRDKEQVEKERRDIKDDFKRQISYETIRQSVTSSDFLNVHNLLDNNRNGISTMLLLLQEKVNELLPKKPIKVSDDPQKDRWGGSSRDNGKQLQASVGKGTSIGLFTISITVSMIENNPMTEPVAIFLHDSYRFPNNVIFIIPSVQSGNAEFILPATEAFTLGALFADGTELELDLNAQTGYPSGFYSQ